MTPTEKARSAALQDAIETVLHEHADHDSDRGLTTDWMLIVEQVGGDGEPYVRMMHAESSLQWRRIGLLDFALTVQKAVIANDYIGEET